jgi:hypothetical protein
LALVTLVFAASIAISSNTYQAEFGSTMNVANGLIATDKGFSVATASSNGTSCLSPVMFGPSAMIANTNTVAGHFVYDVQVNWTTAPPNRLFNVTLVLASSSYGPLCIQTPSSPASDEMIDCIFDVGVSLPNSPYSFMVTVQ